MKKSRLSVILFCSFLTFMAYSLVFAGMELRVKATKLDEKGIQAIVEKHNFYDIKLNAKGNCPNDFQDNGNGTVTDRATGLMWEQGGTDKELSWSKAKKYLKNLNKSKFAGYNDWRFPTIEELYSILDPNPNQGIHVDPVFSTSAIHCWSIDTSKMSTPWAIRQTRKVTLDFSKGTVADAFTGSPATGGSATNYYSHVKAVRSNK